MIVTNAGNGWWRIVMTATSGITSGNYNRGFMLVSMAVRRPLATTLFWGAQLEAGSFATSYIPTVASQVTRAADQASIVAPNFAPWYNQSEGTLVAEFSSFMPTAASQFAWTISNGTGEGAMVSVYGKQHTSSLYGGRRHHSGQH